MSAKMRRRRRQARARRIRRQRRELGLFYTHGRFPSNAVVCAACPCGSRAFSTDPHDMLEDWNAAHEYCT